MLQTIIVVPCFNESRRLAADRFLRFAAENPGVRFLMVDDGSTDATWDCLCRLQEQASAAILTHQLTKNSGKAEAVRQGILQALSHRPDYVGYLDADLATPLEELPALQQVFDENPQTELVLGCRLSLLGHCIQRRFKRWLLSWIFSWAASLALGIRFRDTQCGVKLFRVTPACQQVFGSQFISRWIFDVEILARLKRLHEKTELQKRVYESALGNWHEVPGSKLRTRDFFWSVGELLAIYWKYLRPACSTSSWLPQEQPIILQHTSSPKNSPKIAA